MSLLKYHLKESESIIIITFVLLSSIALSFLILIDIYRYAILVTIAPIFFYLLLRYSNSKNIIKILIVSVYFGIPLNISKTNIGPTSQYLIILVFLTSLSSYIIKKKGFPYNKKIYKNLALLFICGIISTLGVLNIHDIFRDSFWSLINLMTGGFFLLLLDSLRFYSFEEKNKYFLEVMDLIIVLTCIHILIGIVVFNIPALEKYLSIFYSRNLTEVKLFDITGNNINSSRLRTIFLSVESLGEFIAVVMPYVLFRLLDRFQLIDIVNTIILTCGLVLCGTRSAFLLSILSLILFLLFIEPSNKKKITALFLFATTAYVIIYFDVGVSIIASRFTDTFNAYSSGDDVLSVSNRGFFRANFFYFLDNLSLFGNGLISPLRYGILSIDFHNLYLSIFFQYGIIGAMIYFLLPIRLLIQSFTIPKEYIILKKAMLLSICIFLINEFKYEFTRSNNHVIIMWILFSLYYLHNKKSHNVLKENLI